MCFAAAEAASLAGLGFDDLLVGYPTLERSELESAASEVSRGRSITLTVDDVAQLEPLEAAASHVGVVLAPILHRGPVTRSFAATPRRKGAQDDGGWLNRAAWRV